MTTKAKASTAAPAPTSGYAKRVDDLSALFEGLEGVDGERLTGADTTGTPLEILLDEIEEDPEQPRKSFDEAALKELAASIRERGILQAITVRPRGQGAGTKHRIVYGARRYRAARMAGLTAIKAVVREVSDADAYDQMIENIQRDDLSASEIAAFVTVRVAQGESQSDVARRLGKDRSYVAMHAAVADMPGELRLKLDVGAPIRGVYELYQAWKKHPEAILAFCAERETFTRMEALGLVKALKSPPADLQDPAAPDARSPGSDGSDAGTGRSSPPSSDSGALERVPAGRHHETDAKTPPEGTSAPTAGSAAARPALVTLFVEHRRRRGRLHLDQSAGKGSRFGLVEFDNAPDLVEIALSELRLAELVAH